MLANSHKTADCKASRPHVPSIESLDCRRMFSSIAGLWTGSRTEVGLRGTFGTVTVDLNLAQHGKHISGTERRSSPSASEYFADIITGGTFAGNIFNLQDQSITASHQPSDYTWLPYQATLTLSRDGQTLSGVWHAHNVVGMMALSRVPLPRLTLASADTLDNDGVTVHYVIATTDITEPLRFDIYRSSEDHLNTSSQLIGSQMISPHSHARLLAVGPHRITLIPGTSLAGDKKRPFVIIVANSNHAVLESTDSINAVFFRLQAF
jgi:hypothetical protein